MPVGELAFLALVGVILLGSVGVLHVRAEPPDRVVSRTLMWLFALLVLFGVVIDGIHHLVFTAAVFDAPFTTLEDGGKLLSLSLVVGFLFAVTFCGHDPRLARLAVASVEGANR